MPLTKSFNETIKNRALRDPEFRIGLLQEATEAFLRSDIEEGKILLRDYVNSTVGFEALALSVHKHPKSLMRMLSPGGNPRVSNLFDMIAFLQKAEGVYLTVHHQPIAG